MRCNILIFAALFFLLACGSSQKNEEKNDTAKKDSPIQKDTSKTKVSQALNEEIAFDKYCNARYDYCIEYPKDVLIPQGESDNGDGQVFVSQDKTRKLTVWGENNALDETLKDRYNAACEGKTLTYKLLEKDFFVVSGKNADGTLFYQKTKVGKENTFDSFLVEYPQEKQSTCSKVIERMAKSF